MKNIKILFVVSLLTVLATVNAQSVVNKEWSGLRLSYDSYAMDRNDGSDLLLDAVPAYELGYVKSFSVSKKHPLFIETGANFIMTHGDLRKGYTLDLYSFTIPINLGYKVFSSENISFFPYVGFVWKTHLWGEISDDYNDLNIDLLDNEMGDGINRCQAAWQIGVTMNIKRFNLGVSYADDFMDYDDFIETTTLRFTAGFNF